MYLSSSIIGYVKSSLLGEKLTEIKSSLVILDWSKSIGKIPCTAIRLQAVAKKLEAADQTSSSQES